MARVPGTETPFNHDGWQPGQAARGRRCRAAAEQGLADRHGLVTEVRPTHVRVLFQPHGPSLWLANDIVFPAEVTGHADLDLIRRVMLALHALRLEFEDLDGRTEITVFSPGFASRAVVSVRRALGERLESFVIEPHGVHELAVRLRIALDSDGHPEPMG